MTDPLDNNIGNEPSNNDDETSNVTSLEDRLSAHFHGEAELIPVAESLGRSTSLDAVRERAEKRRSRRQAGVGVAAAACIAVIGFGALQLGGGDQENDVAAVETTTTLAEPADPADDAGTDEANTDEANTDQADGADPIAGLLSTDGPKLGWQEVTGLPESVNGFSIAATPDAFYAPATEDGITTAVYRSTDGLTWEPIATDLPIAGFRLQSAGNALLLEGEPGFITGADARPPTFEYLISRDQGQTWSEIELPSPEPIATEVNGITYEKSNSVSIASAGNALVVVQTAFVFADITQLLEEDGVNINGYDVTSEGVRVFGEDENFSGEGTLIPFDEITAFDNTDLSDQELADLLQSNTSLVEIFGSVDGGPFEPIDLALPDGIDFAGVTTSNGVAVLQVFGSDLTSYRSSDGVTWTQIEADTDVELFGAPGNSGQSLVGFGSDGLLESLDGGETWTNVGVSPFVQPIGFVRSNLGVTVVGSGSGSPDPGLVENPVIELSKDNLTFTMSFENGGEGDMVLTDNVTGEELRRITPDELDPDGENGPGLRFDEASQTIEISSLETGEVLMTFTVDELMDANPEIAPDGIDEFSFVIGHSTDGETYGWIRVSELAASPDSFPMVAATDDVIMVFFDGPVGGEVFVAAEVAR